MLRESEFPPETDVLHESDVVRRVGGSTIRPSSRSGCRKERQWRADEDMSAYERFKAKLLAERTKTIHEEVARQGKVLKKHRGGGGGRGRSWTDDELMVLDRIARNRDLSRLEVARRVAAKIDRTVVSVYDRITKYRLA